MSYNLATQKKDGYLHITASGVRSLETVMSITRDVLAVCMEENVWKVLIDLHALEGHLETFEAYRFADQYLPELEGLHIIERCAILDRKEAEERLSFFETAAVNRGFFLRFFTSAPAATEWLNS